MRTLIGAAAVLLALAAAVPAQAQRTTGLRVGQSAQGRLSDNDPAMFQRGRFKVYQFRAQPGVRYVATLRSPDFDAYLTLARTTAGITDYMMTDDDGGSENDARLRFEVPSAGNYLLIAQSLPEDGTGAYTLALDTTSTRLPQPRDVRVGEVIRGELTDDDADFVETAGGDDGSELSGYYDLYRFEATAGQRLRIRMALEEFAPAVAVGTLVDGAFTPLAQSEVAAADTGAATIGTINFRVPEDGEYYVRAGAYGEVTGEYSLTILPRAATPQPRATPVRRGQTVTGALRPDDPQLEDGRRYDAYSYTGRAGERIRISLTSDAFDAVLVLGRVVDGEFQELETNDDADDGPGTNALIVIELPEDGRYVIQATSFRAGTQGAYRLTVGAPRQD
jgi:hypothetical protein